MNKEINKIITNLENCFGIFDYSLTPKESNLLVLYLKELQQENKQLKYNWNKLKEYLHNVDVVVDYSENYDGHFINYDELIDKMQGLDRE